MLLAHSNGSSVETGRNIHIYISRSLIPYWSRMQTCTAHSFLIDMLQYQNLYPQKLNPVESDLYLLTLLHIALADNI